MSKTMVLGAHGRVGKQIVERLGQSGSQVFAGVRKESQFDEYKDLVNVTPVLFNLTDQPEEMAKVFKDNSIDSVVFAAGSGGSTGDDQTLIIDLDGAIKSMIATKSAGIKRYIMLSGIFVDNRPFWDEKWGNYSLKTYYIAKHYADEYLKNDSDLDYTIIRPVSLTDGDATGDITTVDESDTTNSQRSISRADVANFIVNVMADKSSYGRTFAIANK